MTKDNINDSDLERAAHDLSKDDREAFSRQLEDLEKDFKNMKRWSDGHIAPRLRELAGSQLEGMLANQEETLKYLTDPNPKLRQAALQLAYRHWEITYTLAN